MKKLLFLLIGILMVSLVTAGLLPQMMVGTVKLPGYSTLEGLDLELRNTRTQQIYTVQLDANGFYQFDWNNAPYLNGDTIEITVKVCREQPSCKLVTRIIEDEPQSNELIVPSNFGLVQESKIVYICPNGAEVPTLNECLLPPERVVNITRNIVVEKIVTKEVIKEVPTEVIKVVPREIIKTIEVSKYYCADGSLAEDAAECLDTSKRVKEYALGAGIGVIGAGFAGLIAYYVKKKKRVQAKKMIDTYIKKRKK